MTIPSLSTYVLVEQTSPAVVAFRRNAQGIQREVLRGKDAVLTLPEVGVDLRLADVYEEVDFAPERDEED
jgi:hypothetical protein